MKALALLLALLSAGASAADTVISTRNLRPGSVLLPTDLTLAKGEVPGSYTSVEQIVGQEAKVAIYAGRPVMIEQVGPPATVERNQFVQLIYASNGLTILAEGRALGRGAEGQRIRVMNMTSKSSLFGTVQADGSVLVSQ